MKTSEYEIRPGEIEDAPFISKAIMEALGHELCVGLAEGEENLGRVRELFTQLAALRDSQYSYKNTLVAVDSKGKEIGAIICYDGGLLEKLRVTFIEKANELLGWNVTVEEAENWEPETDGREFYIDSLYVEPEFRNKGIASALIHEAEKKGEKLGKPIGILVEPENERARRLYEHLGFKPAGINCFCGVPMTHLQHP